MLEFGDILTHQAQVREAALTHDLFLHPRLFGAAVHLHEGGLGVANELGEVARTAAFGAGDHRLECVV